MEAQQRVVFKPVGYWRTLRTLLDRFALPKRIRAEAVYICEVLGFCPLGCSVSVQGAAVPGGLLTLDFPLISANHPLLLPRRSIPNPIASALRAAAGEFCLEDDSNGSYDEIISRPARRRLGKL